MNIFVLCTGRCGSTTFSKACSEIRNYSSGHETRTSKILDERMCYPQNHIEVDNRLSWLLGRLDKTYGNDAFYVHLRRNEEKVVESFEKRYERGIIKAYRGSGIMLGLSENVDSKSVCRDYVRTVTENIDLFLSNKSNVMSVWLEDIKTDFPEFCNQIAADVSIENALEHFNLTYNASK
ncbi:hypothetical protein [Idiomarina ramblicola]|nr:hypothetical protein [Idiomarina ramblicola]